MTPLRLFHPDAGTPLVLAPGDGEGWWAGAPSRADRHGLASIAGTSSFWEHELPDGAHERRLAAPTLTVDAATLR